MRRKRRKHRIRWRDLLFLLVLLLGAVFLPNAARRNRKVLFPDAAEQTAREESTGEKLRITFLDVGQGNAVFLRSGGHTMLVDGGPADSSSSVVRFLKDQGVERLDYIIATHYDADHISGLIGVLHAFAVDAALVPGYLSQTRTGESFRQMREKNGCREIIPARGERYALGEAEFTVVAPASYQGEGDNNNSIGIRVVCGNTSFLLLGDAEQESEEAMLESGLMLRSDVYLASHHGSATSSGNALLDAVLPSAVVISCGRENDYGHPAESTLRRLEEHGAVLYRTDRQGDITAFSDGERVRFEEAPCNDWTPGDGPEKSRAGESTACEGYIGNIHSQIFHRPDCDTLPLEQNRVLFSTREEAVQAGYEPCGFCRP